MADDFDVDSMLEAPYKKEDEVERGGHHDDRDRSEKRSKDKKRSKRSRSRDRDRRDRDRDSKRRERDRDRDRDREANGTRDKERHKREREHRSRSRDHKSRSPRERRSRSRERKSLPRDHHHERKRSRERRRERRYSISPIRRAEPELTPEERDARTVFVMQLSARIRPRDLEEFFSSVGKVRDVRIITDNKTRRSKGIAYIEFAETDSVPLAMGLQGQRLLGVPIIVQASQAEKNRIGQAGAVVQKGMSGPMRLYVGSLHFNITEDMLRGIFEPFGKIDQINLMMDSSTGRSKGFGFITFHNAEDAKKALEQLNGFELAGRPMKVGHVTERTADTQGSSALDSDEMDRAGIDLGATGRLQLMAKLAEGTGFQIPNAAANALNMNSGTQPPPPAATGQNGMQQSQSTPPIATQCFLLSNMFDPASETSATWDVEIRDDVIEQCNKHGGVLHIYVDKASPQGNVYVKCPSIAAAVASVNSLHGRWFAGKVITAAYVPLPNYHSLFPDAQRATQLVMSTQQTIALGLAPGMAAPTAANFH